MRSFEIRFDFKSNFRFGIRFVVMIGFEIFESSAPSIVSSLDGVTACVVYTADFIRKFDSKSNRTADSIRDSIRTQKNYSQVPTTGGGYDIVYFNMWAEYRCCEWNALNLMNWVSSRSRGLLYFYWWISRASVTDLRIVHDSSAVSSQSYVRWQKFWGTLN